MAWSEEEREYVTELEKRIQRFENLMQDSFGNKPEGIGQIVAQQRTIETPSVGGTLRVVTTQGEVDLLIK